jgi:hypothetical protein
MKEWLRQRILYILDAQRKMENKKWFFIIALNVNT